MTFRIELLNVKGSGGAESFPLRHPPLSAARWRDLVVLHSKTADPPKLNQMVGEAGPPLQRFAKNGEVSPTTEGDEADSPQLLTLKANPEQVIIGVRYEMR